MRIGTRVKFKKLGHTNTVPNFDCNIPYEILKHGNTVVGSEYHSKGAIIRGENKKCYFVEFIDINYKPVCLGFKKDLIVCMSWRDRYNG